MERATQVQLGPKVVNRENTRFETQASIVHSSLNDLENMISDLRMKFSPVIQNTPTCAQGEGVAKPSVLCEFEQFISDTRHRIDRATSEIHGIIESSAV